MLGKCSRTGVFKNWLCCMTSYYAVLFSYKCRRRSNLFQSPIALATPFVIFMWLTSMVFGINGICVMIYRRLKFTCLSWKNGQRYTLYILVSSLAYRRNTCLCFLSKVFPLNDKSLAFLKTLAMAATVISKSIRNLMAFIVKGNVDS